MLFVGTFAIIGGSLRGINLLLVLAGLMVGALLVQWRWALRSIESVSVKRRLPISAFAGTRFRVRYRLTNRHRLLPGWLLRIDDSIVPIDEDEQPLPRVKPTATNTSLAVLPPRQTRSTWVDCLISGRGRYRFGPSKVSTSFPFSLLQCQRNHDDWVHLDIYPQRVSLKRNWRRHLLSRVGGATVAARRQGANNGEFFGLREWQTGDSLRQIHWRTTARLGAPAVRQFEQQRRFDACLLVDAHVDPSHALASHRATKSFDDLPVEWVIRLAATLSIELSASAGNHIVLALATKRAQAFASGGSGQTRRDMLSALARMTPCANPVVSEAIDQASSLVGHAQDLIVVSTRSRGDATGGDPELAAKLEPWVRRSTLRWIAIDSPEASRIFRRETESIRSSLGGSASATL